MLDTKVAGPDLPIRMYKFEKGCTSGAYSERSRAAVLIDPECRQARGYEESETEEHGQYKAYVLENGGSRAGFSGSHIAGEARFPDPLEMSRRAHAPLGGRWRV